MKAKDVSEELVGKRCKCVFSGLMVTGVIEEVKTSEETVEVKVRYDEPQQWGDLTYTDGWAFARLEDDFGSLRHLEVIDEGYRTLRITFDKPIREIDRMFTSDYRNWQVVNLKEWIDSYESTRFTQTGTHTAIITSEYNMESVKEWLLANTPVAAHETI